MTPKGLFIVLEGIDGSGTTTQARRLVRHLQKVGRPSLLTREPSQGPIGRLIDRLITLGKTRALSAEHFHETIAMLFGADRLHHIDTEIIPALRAGKIVVSDRYVMSSWAYQSVALPSRWVREVNRHSIRADLTILLDVPPRLGLSRVAARGAKAQVFEREHYLRRVRANYLGDARGPSARSGRVVVLDGARSVDAVEQDIWALLGPLLATHS